MTTTAALLFLCVCAPILTETFRLYNNDITSVTEMKKLLRFTRQVVTQHVDEEEEDREEELMWCCDIPEDRNIKDEILREREQREDEKVVQDCRTEVTNILGDEPAPKNKVRIRKEMECFMQCAYEKFNVTSRTGDISKIGYEVLMAKLELTDGVTLNKISHNCKARTKGHGKSAEGYACNPAANNFNHCVYDMMNLACEIFGYMSALSCYCPDDQRPKSKRCDQHRETLRLKYTS